MTIVAIWLTLSGLLIGFLFVINLISRYRSLSAQGIPAPLLVTYQQTLGCLLPTRVEPVETFIGRSALLFWDIRWVTSGNTLAYVTGADPRNNELKLQLSKPIILYATEKAPEIHLENVCFQPKSRSRAAYGKCAIPGRLLPHLTEDLYATATIVIYPKGT